MKIVNKSAPATFSIIDKLEVGIVLLGSEVKAVKGGHADLTGSYGKIIGNEAYVVNAKIFPYKFARIQGYEETRTRKILMHKKEILSLKTRLREGEFTLVPLSLYDKHGLIKLELGLAKGKKKPERKRELRERDLAREALAELKNRR